MNGQSEASERNESALLDEYEGLPSRVRGSTGCFAQSDLSKKLLCISEHSFNDVVQLYK